jgi:hypothetical protein
VEERVELEGGREGKEGGGGGVMEDGPARGGSNGMRWTEGMTMI